MASRREIAARHGPKTYLFAAAVGVIGGLIGTAFQLGRHGLKTVFMGDGSFLEESLALSWWQRFLFPVCAFTTAGLLAYGLTRRRKAQGMADVMEAVNLKRAQHLKVRATFARALSSFVLVAGGGSVGREGPIVYLSASLATRFSRLVQIPAQRLGLFTGCGVSAGMAAAYYAPFGAALFAMEVVLGNFAIDIFAPVVVASVTANFVSTGLAAGPFQGMMKGVPMYDLPEFGQVEPAAILVFLFLGCAAAFVALAFVRTMATTERLFNRIPLPPVLRLPLGGILIGVISIWLPQLWAGGHDTLNWMLSDEMLEPAVWFVLILLVMKILATSITVGSGGSGGLFTPSIFLGAFTGMLIGAGAQVLFPNAVDDPRTYAVVGMAAGLAATTHAPITAIFLLTEMTREFDLVVPLVIASLAGSVTSRYLGLESIYVAPLRKRGIRLPEGIEETTLTTTRVRDIMRDDAVWISETATFDMIVAMVKKTRRDFIYVVDRKGVLAGTIRLHDVKNFLGDEDLGSVVIASDLVVATPSAREDESLADIIARFDDPEIHEMPVLGEHGNIVAVVDRRDLINTLSVEVLQSQALRAKFVMPEGATNYVEMPRGHAVSRIPVPEGMAGQSFGATDFRRITHLSVLTIVRQEHDRESRLLPEADIVLQADDGLIVMGREEDVRKYGGET